MAETLDGSSPSSPTDALDGNSSLVGSSPCRIGPALCSQIEIVDEKSTDNPPSDPAGKASSSSSSSSYFSSLISSNMSNYCKNLDGFWPDGRTESVAMLKSVENSGGGSFSSAQSVDPMCSDPVGPMLSSNIEAPDEEISLVPLACPNGSSPDDQSLVPPHVETLDYDSAVSSPSGERGSSPSSLDESSEFNGVAVGSPSREKVDCENVTGDCDDKSCSPMEVDPKEGSSSLPGMMHHDERDLDDGHDDFNAEDGGRTNSSGSSYYRQRERYHFNPLSRTFSCPVHGRYCFNPRCRWQTGSHRWEWDSSRREREPREDKPPGFSFLMQETGPTGVGAGLSNLGNTCFINAILQCFTHTVSLVKALRSSNHKVPCGTEGFCIHCALCEHIELSLASSGKVVSPIKLFDNLTYISSSFQRYYQEDAHEFLQCLLDRLERCFPYSSPTHEKLSSVEDNVVERVFGGRLLSKLQCCNCGHISNKYEALIDLSLEIEDVDTLQCALESFTKVEKIEDPEAKLMCENCSEGASRKKQLMLDKAPSVAIMHLKRFKTDGLSIEKIGKHVEFPLELNLKPYTISSEECNADLKYQLYAIVVHDGILPTSGHYFCYVRSSPDTWHKLDDSMVIKVEEDFVLSQAAYILFYAKEDTPWFSSLIDTQKLCSNSISNTSPKSVLDNMYGECTSEFCMTNVENGKGIVTEDAADGTFSALSSEKVLESNNGETLDEAVRVSEQISDGTSEQNFCCDESKNAVDPMIAVSEPCGSGECHDAKSHKETSALPSVDENNCNQASNRIIGNGLHPATPPRSPHPSTTGPPGVKYQIPRNHLKVENRVSCKRHLTKAGNHSEIEEALRYAKRNMPGLRRKEIMNLMLENDKSRLRSSLCKRASPPGSRCKSLRHVAVLR